jgi:hypothetical protein
MEDMPTWPSARTGMSRVPDGQTPRYVRHPDMGCGRECKAMQRYRNDSGVGRGDS